MIKDTAKILIEALPYILQFSNKNVLVKLGGSVLDSEDLKETIVQDIVLLKLIGIDVVLVHGGGKHISSLLKRLGKESKFIDGLRVTDKETIEVTQMVLAGLINKDLVSKIIDTGGNAVGVSGKDGRLIKAKKLKTTKKVDYGHVGEIISIDTQLIKTLKKSGYIPVISPIASDGLGNSLNINADLAAVEIAIGLKAEKLIFLTDTDGVLMDVSKPETLIRKVKVSQVSRLVKKKIIVGGMIPKVKSSVNAIKRGVNSIHILNGKKRHSILLELFTDLGVGTQISK